MRADRGVSPRPVPGRWACAALAALLIARSASGGDGPLPVIPVPASVEASSGEFGLDASTPIRVPRADRGAEAAARYLGSMLERVRGLTLPTRPAGTASGRGSISFERRPGLASEAYALEITPARVTITASTDAGLYYGAVTLWQLVPPGAGAVALGAVSIRDQPRYRWRGLMLDSARHYQSPDFIRRLIDGMALHKLNVLHWHLTDDQGWRLEIRRYPALTSVGAYRVPAGRGAREDIDPATGRARQYGGFYSQSTVRELVAYARAHHVLIVPEIDMPGHASAAIAAYPELAVAPTHLDSVPADWGIYPHVYNVEEATCRFLENVLAEVVELFPGPYVHVGGDEVVKSEWQNSPASAARARALGLPDPQALHAYLVQRMGRFLAAHHRRLIGWDEILQPGLATDAIVVSWRGLDGAVGAARRGNDTVLSPWPTLYFDFRQSGAADEPPGRIKLSTLADVYRFDPLPPGLTDAEAAHVLGLQANVWTEHIRTDDRIGHATFPRAAAVAEIGWSSPDRRTWPDFIARVAASLDHYRALGLPYADSDFAVRATRRYDASGASVAVELATESGTGDVRYTTDGSEPDLASPRYAGPLTLPTPAELRAASFRDTQRLAATRVYRLGAIDARRRASDALDLCSEGIALALEADSAAGAERPIVRLDIMNPCWIYRAADLTAAPALVAAVGQIPFNYQIGTDAAKVRVGDARSAAGELEVRIDGCDGEPVALLPLAAADGRLGITTLSGVRLPARPGRHDVCLRFARPTLDPMWALDWVDIAE